MSRAIVFHDHLHRFPHRGWQVFFACRGCRGLDGRHRGCACRCVLSKSRLRCLCTCRWFAPFSAGILCFQARSGVAATFCPKLVWAAGAVGAVPEASSSIVSKPFEWCSSHDYYSPFDPILSVLITLLNNQVPHLNGSRNAQTTMKTGKSARFRPFLA